MYICCFALGIRANILTVGHTKGVLCMQLVPANSSHLCSWPCKEQSWTHHWINIGQNSVQQCERERKKDEKQPCRCQDESTRRGSGAPGTRAEIPLQLVGKTTVEQASPCRQWRQPCQSQWLLLTKSACHEEPLLEQVLTTGTAAGRKHVLDWVYPRGLQPVERTEARAALKSGPSEKIILEPGKSLRRKESQDVLMDSLLNLLLPIPNTLLRLRGDRWVKNEGNASRLGKELEVKGILIFISQYSNLFYLTMNDINFPQIKSGFPMLVIDKWSPYLS